MDISSVAESLPMHALKQSNQTSVWIQGSHRFVTKWKKNVARTKFLAVTSVSVGSKRATKSNDESETSGTLTHTHVGGLTLGRWNYSVPSAVDRSKLHSRSNVTRELRHILDKTLTGISCSNPSEEYINEKKRKRGVSEYIVTENDRVIPGKSQVVVFTQSVRQRAGCIKRFLSLRELLDVYDVQTCWQDMIMNDLPKNVSKAIQHPICVSIVTSVPEKLIYQIAKEVKEACLKLKDSAEPNRERRLASTTSIEWLKYEKEELGTNDEKAARNDDARVATDQWNDYLMRGFDSGYQWTAIERYFPGVKAEWKNPFRANVMICNNGCPDEKRLKLFDLLRDLSAARYSKNVTNGFKFYMDNKYSKEIWWKGLEITRSKRNGNYVRNALSTLLKSKELVEEFRQDVDVGIDAIIRACKSSFWDWKHGSTLNFWRWPKDYVKEARDGTAIYVTKKLPSYKVGQRWPKELDIKEKMGSKLLKVVDREYMKLGPTTSLTGTFPVPKGDSDIRLVYDATKCGLNECLWSPNFMLPTIDMTLRQVDERGWFGDIDLGEMFLNFPLDVGLRQYVGVDLTELREKLIDMGVLGKEMSDRNGRIFLRWVRCLMGLRPSPYNAMRAMGWAEDLMRGDHLDVMNPLRWDEVVLNLPGMLKYNPSKPKVYKWNRLVKRIAANFEGYIDDLRTCGFDELSCLLTSRRVASYCNHLGIQDAPRKRHFPSQRPRVWCGANTMTDGTGVYTYTTQTKWDKGRKMIEGWLTELKANSTRLIDRKGMERGRGFLVHLSRTYPSMVPFMKGIHHTLESWRPGRGRDGWKYVTSDWKAMLVDIAEVKEGQGWKELKAQTMSTQKDHAPEKVVGVDRLERDLDSLMVMFRSKKPPIRLVRGLSLAYVIYGFGDASGAGFGSSWEGLTGTSYRYGVWGKDNVGKSSNYRELRNVVESLESMRKEDKLGGTEIYFFTDNSTAEAAFFKGSSTSVLLHNLVTRLRGLEMNSGCKVVLCHVAGERMKWQGSDGLSRGNLLEGVMTGEDMLSYVPLHKCALERSPKLLNWIKSWAESNKKEKLEALQPNDWYIRGHDMDGGFQNASGKFEPKFREGIFLWHPPPGAAEAACEEIRKARVKRTRSTHIFVCPRLLTPYWRSHLHRSADLVFEIPAGQDYWPKNMFEPLILAIYLPFCSHRPWQLKFSPSIMELGDRLQRLWRSGGNAQGAVLRELRIKAGQLENLQKGMVHQMLHCFDKLGIPCEGSKKRNRSSLETEEGCEPVHGGKKR